MAVRQEALSGTGAAAAARSRCRTGSLVMTPDTAMRTAGMRAWVAECLTADGAPDRCAFHLRNEDRPQLLRLFATHVQETHNNPMSTEALAPYVKEVRV